MVLLVQTFHQLNLVVAVTSMKATRSIYGKTDLIADITKGGELTRNGSLRVSNARPTAARRSDRKYVLLTRCGDPVSNLIGYDLDHTHTWIFSGNSQ
jgi:hypothetical protein